MDRFFAHFFLLVCAHPVFYPRCSTREDHLVVETSAGSVEGRLQSVIHGLSVKQFLGIPYAEPPVGELRFAPPQPAKPWQEVREAKKFGFACPQTSMKELLVDLLSKRNNTIEEEPQSEDCLTLNVCTPTQATPSSKLAVMVWIHGGGFVMGSGSSYNPSVLVAYHNIIVVTFNYRLGVLGFFNIPDTEIKGNYGMFDQVLAFKWVQQHIANFGGDPNNVTIFGKSAGGISAANHLISPLSKGLFQRVIAQSGSASIISNGIHVKSAENLNTFSKVLNCDVDEELMNCLRNKTWTDVLTAQLNVTFPSNMGDQTLTSVVIDGGFLPDQPRNLLIKRNSSGVHSEVQVMMGVTANEGGFGAIMAFDVYKDGVDQNFAEQTIRSVTKVYQPHTTQIEDAAVFEYLDHSDHGNRIKNRQAVFDAFSDHIFNAPAVFEAKALSNADIPVYFYVFDHYPHFSAFPKWLGASHGVDLYFSFGIAVLSDGFEDVIKALVPKFSDLEVRLAHYTMKLWTNFAKHGDPNVGETGPIVTWPHYNSSQHVHLRISMEPKVEHSFRERKVAFWNEFLPKLVVKEPGKESEALKESTVREEL